MRRVLGWIAVIPADRVGLRRVVAARSLILRETGRHAVTWYRLAKLLHVPQRTTREWHAAGVDLILAELARHSPR